MRMSCMKPMLAPYRRLWIHRWMNVKKIISAKPRKSSRMTPAINQMIVVVSSLANSNRWSMSDAPRMWYSESVETSGFQVAQVGAVDRPHDHAAGLDLDAADPGFRLDQDALGQAIDAAAVELDDAGGSQQRRGLADAAAQLLQLLVRRAGRERGALLFDGLHDQPPPHRRVWPDVKRQHRQQRQQD